MKKYLLETHPELSFDWDFCKNELEPIEITYGSGKKVWWICKEGHSWKAAVYSRSSGRGCPYCSGRLLIDGNSLLDLFPILVKEWDFEKNKDVNIAKTRPHSKKPVWWICKEGHSWKAFIINRARRGDGCPYCSGRFPSDNNNLLVGSPDLCKEWDYSKNKLNPKDYTPSSNKKVWWLCRKCGYNWKAMINNRTKKIKPRGCPLCAGKMITDKNNLMILFPEVIKDWDYDKNKIKPKEVLPHTNKKAWWLCKVCNHSWEASINGRTNKNSSTGCPLCSRGPISKGSQKWLDFLGIKDREHYIKNLGFRVDGFDPKTNTIYEFLGDYWHGNPEVFSPEKINSHNKKFFGELHQETSRRFRLLEEAGYVVVFIWENDFKEV